MSAATPHPIPDIPVGEPIDLPEYGTWPSARHEFDQPDADAVEAALLAERPLLVYGEPGSGKSQLARAAAKVLKRAFVPAVVHARSEAADLQWEFDAVSRLAEAQLLGSLGRWSAEPSPAGQGGADGAAPDAPADADADLRRRLDPRRFLSPGPLWWAFHWHAASAHVRYHCIRKAYPPAPPAGCSPDNGCVLLIDEIDKADADLPNSLLETLGNGALNVPWLAEPVGIRDPARAPLVIITSNGERDLPPAFVRRCLVLRLDLPKDDLVGFLDHRGWLHFGDRCPKPVRLAVARQLVKDRVEAAKLGPVLPGQAEYLDILRVLSRKAPGDADAQLAFFKRVAGFALNK